ncbi:PRC-barrel domain-containing protein [Candidatus Nitrospira allomarina]|uniref:PRC-barrel domain-containing protein n=1 Tax=Candidatus Nitrospira allomarina TaxID=3020900 RepID=A0AA96G7J7_9BACT|nr:PRC-barrel domain-containing protein [Candidatus Nitrospira allomarina]WNM56588.1 PRC-barrel domain-containing protein [Candidatus Nitrospira allomarina]
MPPLFLMMFFGSILFLAPFSQSVAITPNQGSYKASELVGKSVKNLQGEDIGQIEELVIGSNGEVGYAVLSFGGFLGVGDKLFAVPWTSLAHQPDREYLTLDIQPEKLEKAPGFNKNDWPDMKDEKWKFLIREFYSTPDQIPQNLKAR